MNTLVKKIAVSTGFVLSLGLASCQEKDVITPDKPGSARVATGNDVISPNLPKVYKLTKFGEATLTYYEDGRLKRVTRGNTNYVREYTYSSNSIKAISYIDNKIALEDTYLLDPITGRCYQSTQADYFLSGGNLYPLPNEVFHTSVWVYAYTAQGQLKSCSKKGMPGTRSEFTYNANGDLVKEGKYLSYLKNGVEQTQPEQYNVTFTYNVPPANRSSDQVVLAQHLADNYPMNFHWIHLPNPYGLDTFEQPIPERYLRIFGKQSQNLMMSYARHAANEPSWSSGAYFTYILNEDGYVTERKERNSYNNNLMETAPYEYTVTSLVVQP